MTKPQCVAANFDADIDIVYAMHDVLKRQSEVEIFPMCIDQAIEIAPYSQRSGGMLTGKYANGGAGGVSETLCMRVGPCEFHGSFVEPFWI